MRPERWLYTVPLRVRSLFGRARVDEDVHAGHVEVARSLQHVAVVRIHLVKAMFLGASQV